MLAETPGGFAYQVAHRRRAARSEERSSLAVVGVSFSIAKRGRFWEVLDGDGALICLTAYKKGAVEVVRRLGLH